MILKIKTARVKRNGSRGEGSHRKIRSSQLSQGGDNQARLNLDNLDNRNQAGLNLSSKNQTLRNLDSRNCLFQLGQQSSHWMNSGEVKLKNRNQTNH